MSSMQDEVSSSLDPQRSFGHDQQPSVGEMLDQGLGKITML